MAKSEVRRFGSPSKAIQYSKTYVVAGVTIFIAYIPKPHNEVLHNLNSGWD